MLVVLRLLRFALSRIVSFFWFSLFYLYSVASMFCFCFVSGRRFRHRLRLVSVLLMFMVLCLFVFVPRPLQSRHRANRKRSNSGKVASNYFLNYLPTDMSTMQRGRGAYLTPFVAPWLLAPLFYHGSANVYEACSQTILACVVARNSLPSHVIGWFAFTHPHQSEKTYDQNKIIRT